jgi:uncharacterized repeat protein (TIGR01451 family)
MKKATRAEQATLTLLVCFALFFVAAPLACAQTVISQPTTTTLWGGTMDFNQFGLADLTAPSAGVILQGTAISPITGQPVRHMWYGDASNGMCRMDPDMDDPGVSSGPGLGSHHNIIQTCIATLQATGFKPGQAAFDETTNTLYSVNVSAVGAAVVRMHYIPSGDNGHGVLDPVHIESLMGRQTGRNAVGGCPMLLDPTKNALPAQPDSISIGPDGNVYVGFKRGGMIVRVTNPATMDPTNPADCAANTSVPMFSADERLGNGHTFGMGWINHDLFGADNIAPWILTNADRCLTPINGNQMCPSTAAHEILAAQVPGPQGGLISDAIYPSFPGNTLFAASLGVVTKITNIANVTSMNLALNYGGSFCFITGLTADTRDLANEPLYVGVDCTGGAINGAAQIWKVMPASTTAGPPGTPSSVVAVAGVNQATVTWSPTPNGQPVTHYVVHASFTSDGSTVPDVTVNPTPGTTLVPNTIAVTGLTNGVSYIFEVQAVNSSGASPFSAPSNEVTPQGLGVPSAPTSVTATAGNASASVAWTAPLNTGGSAVTSYTVSALSGGVPTGIGVSVPGNTTGANVTGLANGTTYTFVVAAANNIGLGPISAPSAPVTPAVPAGNPDLVIGMFGPASVNAGAFVTYSMTVTNNGVQNAAQVSITDNLPGPFQGSTTSQGACSLLGTNFTCNLGAMAPGGSANVTVTVAIGSTAITNTASVQLRDASGALLADPNPANNTASATTNVNSAPIIPPPVAGGGGGGGGGAVGGGGGGGAVGGGGGGGVVPLSGVQADLQLGSSAQNGSPAVNSSDSFTWLVRNNSGTTLAPGAVLTLLLPPSFQFAAATASQGSCTGANPGDSGGVLICSLGAVAGGQSVTVNVTFTPTQVGTVSTTGLVTFAGADARPENNSFTVTIRPR